MPIPYDEEHLTPNDPNAEYEYDEWGLIKPPFWIDDYRDGWLND